MRVSSRERLPVRSRGPAPSNTEVVADALREAIVKGWLRPGERIKEIPLSEQLGVSRGPIREALRLLEREGLVEAELNRRVRVAPFSPSDLEELYALRIVNEALGVRASVPHLTPQDLADLHADIEQMEALAGTDVGIWEPVHRHFHHGLIAYSGPRIVRLAEQLSDHAERYRLVYVTQDPRAWSVGAAEHREIVAACVDGDAAAAADALARHLARTAGSVLMHVAPDHDPSLVRDAVRAASSIEPAARPRVASLRT